ncbi:hypothetical protein HQ529_01415 [Candidatus Woesearchaeota archaeon]|nr:hypothetical protein [Candidatus Woesearchaeota archaeon]
MYEIKFKKQGEEINIDLNEDPDVLAGLVMKINHHEVRFPEYMNKQAGFGSEATIHNIIEDSRHYYGLCDGNYQTAQEIVDEILDNIGI